MNEQIILTKTVKTVTVQNSVLSPIFLAKKVCNMNYSVFSMTLYQRSTLFPKTIPFQLLYLLSHDEIQLYFQSWLFKTSYMRSVNLFLGLCLGHFHCGNHSIMNFSVLSSHNISGDQSCICTNLMKILHGSTKKIHFG